MRSINLLASECEAYTQNCDSKKLYASDKLLIECGNTLRTIQIEMMLLQKKIEYLEYVASVELVAIARRKKLQQPLVKGRKKKS